jgi:uncharacterized membrane protein YjjP (DUF1212 family)
LKLTNNIKKKYMKKMINLAKVKLNNHISILIEKVDFQNLSLILKATKTFKIK